MRDPSPLIYVLAYGKDVVGLVGTIVATVPFFQEWRLKSDIAEANSGNTEGEGAKAIFSAIAERFRERFFSPTGGDFGLVSVGLGLVSLSFIMSFVLTCLT